MFKLRRSLVFSIIIILATFSRGSSDIINEVDSLSDPSSSYDHVVNIGKLIDDNLGDIREALSSMDPSSLPFISLMNKGYLTNGQLHNLSLLERTGKCSIKYFNKILSIELNLGWDDIKYNYEYFFVLWFVERRGILHGSIDRLRINIALHVDLENYEIVLENFEFTEVGKLGLKLEGTKLAKLKSFFARIILNLAKNSIIKKVEVTAIDVLNKLINEFNEHLPKHKRQFTFIDLYHLNQYSYNLEYQ